MPRKKPAVTEAETTAPAPETKIEATAAETKPKARRTAKKTPEAPVVAEAPSTPEPAKPTRAKRAAKAPVPEVAAPAEVPAPEPTPAKTRSRKKAEVAPEPVVETPKARSRKTAKPEATTATPVVTKERRTRKAAPKAEPSVESEAEIPAAGPIDWAYVGLPEPIWRARGSAAAPAKEEAAVLPGKGRRRKPEPPKPVAAPVAEPVLDEAEAEEADAETEGTEGEAETDSDSDRGPRKRRRRRRGGKIRGESAGETTEEAPITPEPEVATPVAAVAPVVATTPVAPMPTVVPQERPEPIRRDRTAPKAPEKALIAIPETAPQIVVRNGVPTLVRNGRVYPPIFFFGNPADERRSENVLDEVRMAAESGIHLHSYIVEFEVDPRAVDEAVGVAAYMLAKSVEIDPESQVIFRIDFLSPRGWEEQYPDGRYREVSGASAGPSVCDEAYWSVARNCLETFVRKLSLLELKDHILGLHLERGEWFNAEDQGYDTSKAAQRGFRDWARTRYGNDEVTLRASWFDGSARFDTITIPPYKTESPEGEKFIRSSRKQRRFVDYHLFLSDATVSRLGDLAYAAKAASEGNFLVGVSYGYTFEWSHPDSGHLSLGKLLRAPEIDFIAGPPSYRSREPGGSAPFPAPIDSFALNGKLYLSEEDYKTSLSNGHEPDDFNPRLKTPQALDAVHWRGAGAALAHGSGVAWMDLWGNGWLKTHSVWERAKQVREAMIDRMAAPLGEPEVAVFIDERSLAYLVDSHAFALLVQNVRESILRAGVSAGFYLLSDLAHREKFPESKLYLFLNAWDIRPELRSAIKNRLQRNNKVLFWLYSAGLFDAGRDSLERAREVTGIALKPQPYHSKPGTTIIKRHALSEAFPNRTVSGGNKLEPSYFAIPEGATVLGEYAQTGLPSFVVKEFNEGPAETHWTSVFLGEPQVNPVLIRALAQMAGAHVWNFQEDVVHVRPPFCTVHCSGAGPRTLTLPAKYSAYNLLSNEWVAVDTANVRFNAVDGSTHCFLIGPKDELETLLRADPNLLLRMEQLPPREANIRADVSNFDVPIMRLDEWIEGGDSDDNADEWFLRPTKVEEEPPAPATATDSGERVGRRRRRRRGGRQNDDQGGTEESSPSRTETSSEPFSDDEFGLNVMFRKRG